jgi:hypothetical protein
MGITTLELKRPHKYTDGGINIYYPGYPYTMIENPIIPTPLSLLVSSAPALGALMITILNGIYLFTGRINKEIKLWVKILIIVLNVGWLLFALLIPTTILPSIKHPLVENVKGGSTLYGVYQKMKEKKK